MAITATGGAVLGHRPLSLEGIGPSLFRNQLGVRFVQSGFQLLRAAGPEDADLPVLSTWGFQVITVLGNMLFVPNR